MRLASRALLLTILTLLLTATASAGELARAIQDDDLILVQDLIKETPALLDVSLQNGTPLHIAAERDRVRIAEFLLFKGARTTGQASEKSPLPFDPTAASATPLHYAAAGGSAAIVELLASHGDIDARDSFSRTPLHYAAVFGQPAAVAKLVAAKAKIMAKDDLDRTPLHLAAISGKPAIIQILIDKGADIRAQDSFGWTPLHYAAQYGRPDAVELLISLKADVNRPDRTGLTPLHAAVDSRRFVPAKPQGPNKNSPTAKSHDPAAKSFDLSYLPLTDNRLKTASKLLAAGAKVLALDDQKCTPLHYAAHGWNTQIVRLLLKSKASPAMKDSQGQYPTASLPTTDNVKGQGSQARITIQIPSLPRSNGSPGDVEKPASEDPDSLPEINALLESRRKLNN